MHSAPISSFSMRDAGQVSHSKSSASSKNRSSYLPQSLVEESVVNYQDELVLVFYDAMLDLIVERYVVDTSTVSYGNKSQDTVLLEEPTTDEDLTTEEFSIDQVYSQIPNIQVPETPKIPEKESFVKKQRSKTKSKQSMMSQKSRSQKNMSTTSSRKGNKRTTTGSITDSRSKQATVSDVIEIDTFEQCNQPSTQLAVIDYKLVEDDWFVSAVYEVARIEFKNGNVYEGELSRRTLHGRGTFRWANGAVYEGDFKKGAISGRGILTLPNRSEYNGDFCKGYFQGIGTFNMVNTPMVYSGEWKFGMKHGKGWLLYDKGDWYDGEWKEDQRHGHGIRQYANGAKYSGNWHEGKRDGNGSMVWENNDFYSGEWKGGFPHGEGEYIWRTFRNNSFAFPSQNYYKGSWENGMRNGQGAMNFGLESGAKLKGTWTDNLKHGPGVMVCGNGKIIKHDHLFRNDKPIHLPISAIQSKVSLIQDQGDASTSRKLNLESGSIQTVNGEEINPLMYCHPLEIPILSITSQVELGYYIDKIIKRFTQLLQPKVFEFSTSAVENESNTKAQSKSLSTSRWNVATESIFLDPATVPDSETEGLDPCTYLLIRNSEEKQLRNLITTYLAKLRSLYHNYACTAAEPDKISFKPVMIRLFLWQFYTDIKITDKGISLIETDLVLADNEESGIDSKHDPFETIYFWQFIQSMVGTCALLYSEHEVPEIPTPHAGILPFLFKKFLDEMVFNNLECSKKICLSKYRDMLPIKAVYKLYLTLGDPPTARDFLNRTCVKRGQEPECTLDLKLDREKPIPKDGFNAVPIGHEIFYLPKPRNVGERPWEPPDVPMNEDRFCKDLKTFRTLGPRRILNCITKHCPLIKSEGLIVNIDYPMTFLEFFESLISCASAMVDRQIRKEKRLRRQESLLRQELLTSTELSLRQPSEVKMKKGRKTPKTR